MTRFLRDEKGANLFEYVLLVAFALTVIVAIRGLFNAIKGRFQEASAELTGIE